MPNGHFQIDCTDNLSPCLLLIDLVSTSRYSVIGCFSSNLEGMHIICESCTFGRLCSDVICQW